MSLSCVLERRYHIRNRCKAGSCEFGNLFCEGKNP
jgi:hypothetical protein